MSFLLNRDTFAGAVRNVQRVNNRFLQNLSQLHISALTVMDLERWLVRPRTPASYLQVYWAMVQQVSVLNVGETIAHQAARIGNRLPAAGPKMSSINLLIASTALVHGLTLVTKQTKLFSQVPGLIVVDWFLP